jgi:hypothetical protein
MSHPGGHGPATGGAATVDLMSGPDHACGVASQYPQTISGGCLFRPLMSGCLSLRSSPPLLPTLVN